MKEQLEETFGRADAALQNLPPVNLRQLQAMGIFASGCVLFTVTYASTKAILMIGKIIQNRR